MQFYMEMFSLIVLVFSLLFVHQFIQKRRSNTKHRRQSTTKSEPGIGNLDTLYEDEIISVRKKSSDGLKEEMLDQSAKKVDTLVLHVMAEKNKPFLGYDLLQILLSQGLKFGEMNIFHRYQETNGKGPRLFSVASAVEPGTFDIHQMGSQSYGGITLFMQFSGSSGIDKERFSLMCATAKELADTLGGELQNERRARLTDKTINHYRDKIIEAITAQAVA